MIKVIDKLFNGNIAESENLFTREESKRNKHLENADNKMGLLMATMNDKQKELFAAWQLEENELWCDEVETAYIRGFKTGVHIIVEAYNFEI